MAKEDEVHKSVDVYVSRTVQVFLYCHRALQNSRRTSLTAACDLIRSARDVPGRSPPAEAPNHLYH